MVTTTGVDSTTTTTTQSTQGSIGSNILLTLGSGTGINVDELATNLVNAQKIPAEQAIQDKIDKTNAKISGYGLISLQLDTLATSFENINDDNEIYSTEGKSSNETAVSFLSVTNDALEGGYDINVYQLAENHRISSNSYQSTSGNINNSDAFDITLSIGTTRKGTYDHAITLEQLQAVGDDPTAYIKYTDGNGDTLTITQAEIDAAMESLYGDGQYTFNEATVEGLIKAINTEISANAGTGFASSFSSAEIHRTLGISFIQADASVTATLVSAKAETGNGEVDIGLVSQGAVTAAPVNGVAASYTYSPGALTGTNDFDVSDGITTISFDDVDLTTRTDYELSLTEAEVQTALNNNGTISITGTVSGGGSDETLTIGLADITTFGLPIPLGAVTLQDLSNAFNTKASADFETTATVKDNKLTFVQKVNNSGSVSSPTSSEGVSIALTTEAVTATEQMAEAIQASGYYNNLKFTVSASASTLVFDYKADGVVSTPSFKLNDVDETASSSVAGVNAVNAPVDTVIKIAAGADTLPDIVEAINKAKTGITASLLDVSGIGNDYQIVLSGEDGLDGTFTVSTSSSTATDSLGFDLTNNLLQQGQDAEIGYEGLLIHRGSNVISDVIDGATFQLNALTGRVLSTPYVVLADGSGTGNGFAYDITEDSGTIYFTPKQGYVNVDLSTPPSGGPGTFVAETITNPYGSSPAEITRYKITGLANSDIDTFLDNSGEPDYAGSITLNDGIGGVIFLPRNGLGGFWPNSATTQDGETVSQYVAVAQAASLAAGSGGGLTGGTSDSYTNFTGGTINPVKSGEYKYAYTEAQLRADVAASIRNDNGEGHLIFTDDYGNDLVVETSRIRQLSGGGGTSSIAIDNPDFLYIDAHDGQNYAGHSHNGDLIDWTMTGDTGSWWIGDGSDTYIDESTIVADPPTVGWIYGSGGALEQTLSTNYQTGSNYEFQVDIGDTNYYDGSEPGGVAWKIEIFAGTTLVDSQTGSSAINAMATKTLSFDANNSSLNGQALKIKISKTDTDAADLLIGNITGTVTETGAGEETLQGLLDAIQEDENYPENGTADNDWRFLASLDGSGLVFSPATSNTSPQLTSGGETAGVAMFRATRTSASSTSIDNNNVNMDGGYQNNDGKFEALTSTPGTPGSGNYSNTGTITSTVGTTGGGTFRIAYTDAQLQMDLLASRIKDEGDNNHQRGYISFTDSAGNTIMVERSSAGIGNVGNETIANLVTALQSATVQVGSSPATSNYADFGYTVSADANGLVFSPKTAPSIGDTLSLQMKRSQNNFETDDAADGPVWTTQEPLTRTIIEDIGLIPGNPGNGGGTGSTYLTKYITETVYDSARLTITQDKSQLKTNLQEIVTAYNDLEGLIDELNTDEAVELELSLAGEGSLLRSVQSRIYNALTATSSTASGSVDAIRDLGISVDRYGKLQFDEGKYDSLIVTNWDDVVTMLTADTTDQSLYSPAPKGLGQDVATIINGLKASTAAGDIENGLVANRTEALEKAEQSYQEELAKLEARMAVIYQRYLTQFTAMEALVNSLNNTRDYMESQIDVITSAYSQD